MSWGRNNLAPHALLSVLCDSLSLFSAGLNLGRHLGRHLSPLGAFPLVAGNRPNTSLGCWDGVKVIVPTPDFLPNCVQCWVAGPV